MLIIFIYLHESICILKTSTFKGQTERHAMSYKYIYKRIFPCLLLQELRIVCVLNSAVQFVYVQLLYVVIIILSPVHTSSLRASVCFLILVFSLLNNPLYVSYCYLFISSHPLPISGYAYHYLLCFLMLHKLTAARFLLIKKL